MRQLVYTSIATADFAEGDLFRIVSQSARKNGDIGLSGFLLYSNRRFLQLLEGPADQISALYGVIQSDKRHCDCTVVLDEQIAHSAFSKWSMRRVRSTSNDAISAEIAEQAGRDVPSGLDSIIRDFLSQPAAS